MEEFEHSLARELVSELPVERVRTDARSPGVDGDPEAPSRFRFALQRLNEGGSDALTAVMTVYDQKDQGSERTIPFEDVDEVHGADSDRCSVCVSDQGVRPGIRDQPLQTLRDRARVCGIAELLKQAGDGRRVSFARTAKRNAWADSDELGHGVNRPRVPRRR